MSWSIEDLQGEGYGLVETVGKTSRTVYTTTNAADAQRFLAMAEIYELVKCGAPVEAFKKSITPKPKGRRK